MSIINSEKHFSCMDYWRRTKLLNQCFQLKKSFCHLVHWVYTCPNHWKDAHGLCSSVFPVDFELLLPHYALGIHVYLLSFRVVRRAGVYGNVSVDVKVGNNTKKLFPRQQIITFKEGEKYRTFEVHIVDDDLPELNQKNSLELSNVLGIESSILFVTFLQN